MPRALKQVAWAAWPARYQHWVIEIAMRYLPLARQIREFGYAGCVTEVGSGDLGITPYLGRMVVGVDRVFTAPHDLLQPVTASALALPFSDRSRPCVLSTDMLEHVPPNLRAAAVAELIRVTGDLLILAVPAGRDAEVQDRDLDARYLARHGERYAFLVEHVDNGLPTPEEIQRLLTTELARAGRVGEVRQVWNTNLRLRGLLMRLWMVQSSSSKALWHLLNLAHPVLSRAHGGTCYRSVSTVLFSDP